jgi:hypothetical protein
LSSSSRQSTNDFLQNNQDIVISYLTDVEGDKAYLDRYVETSKVLEFVENSDGDDTATPFRYPKRIDFTNPTAMLVYGGDVWDKGGYDLYVIRQLLDLKRRHPNRVLLILGNRDINKLRIVQEMGVRELPPHPGLSWFQGTGRVGDPKSNPPPTDAVERLQWILSQTMGSPDAFEHRRNELEWERRGGTGSSDTVSGEDVVESYRESCHPKGELGQYLSQAQLATQIGPLLFVHGCLPLTPDVVMNDSQSSVWDDLTFCMPWLPEGETAQDHGVTTVDDWIVALNQFCSTKVQEWKDQIQRLETGQDYDSKIWAYKGGYHYGPSYSALIQYGMGMLPGRKQNPTVVYNSFTPSGMPHRFYPDSEEPQLVQATREFFDRAKVQIILTGHKPQGDMPSPIRVDDSSWVLCCDTSYSGDTIWHSTDMDGPQRTNLGRGEAVSFRGDVAVSEVLLRLRGDTLQSVQYHGVLSDGTEYETVNLLDHAHNSTIGQVAPDHLVPSELDSPHQGRWWTKSIFSDGSHLFHAGEGFSVWNFVSKPKS